MKFIDELRNLDRNNIGSWPRSAKVFFTGLVFLLVILIGWYFYVSSQQEELDSLVAKEQQLKQDFIAKQAKAVNLVPLQQQLDEMKDMLRQLLRQLPSKTEMPELLVDISQAALSAGLQVDSFTPQPEVLQDFYAEKPIQLRMVGSYHQFGTFISGVASLPRVVILTMHDVALTPEHAGKDGASVDGQLVLQGIVKTYRYLDEDEMAAAAKKNSPNRAGGRP